MRISLSGAAILLCVVASVLAQDNQSASSSNVVTDQTQSSQSQTQAASSNNDTGNSRSQTGSASNSQTNSATTSAPPVTSVYSTAFETYSLSSSQTVSYTFSGNVTTVIQASSTSKSAVTLPTAGTTAPNGDAGGAATITAPDPGNTSFRNAGPDDNYTSWADQVEPLISVIGAGMAFVLVGASLV